MSNTISQKECYTRSGWEVSEVWEVEGVVKWLKVGKSILTD